MTKAEAPPGARPTRREARHGPGPWGAHTGHGQFSRASHRQGLGQRSPREGEPTAEDIDNYTSLLRQVWGDGVLLPFEKRALDGAREEYGISVELHSELEENVKIEMGLDDQEEWL